MATPLRTKAAKPYKVVKPKKHNRRSTPSTRNFRFQTFTERISNLKIDPIRRRKYVEGQEQLPEESRTYFGQSLQEWMDMNLSQTFSAFVKEASPLCDSLALVLHNEDRIMNLLVEYIGRADALAMEPLLSLMAHFAHDLDTRFEAHFARAVSAVIAVAATHSDFAVIEWSFTCLAWLFKYLSRLLAPDLRPLYDLLAPYLGRGTQKPFVVRFTAEALTFLLRKAAVVYERDRKPLDSIMLHMLKDCDDHATTSRSDMHQQGLMTLFTDAVKSVQCGIHSCGLPIIESMLGHGIALFENQTSVISDIMVGTLTSLIHHCTVETFQPILKAIQSSAKDVSQTPSPRSIEFVGRSIHTVVSVRKGSRISDWTSLTASIVELVNACDNLSSITTTASSSILSCVAITLQTATIDAVLLARDLPMVIRTKSLAPFFLEFCDLCSRLGTERSESFVFPQFQSYLLQQKSSPAPKCLILMSRFGRSDLQFRLPPAAVSSMLANVDEVVKSANPGDEEMATARSMLTALRSSKLDEKQESALEELIAGSLRSSLASDNSSTSIRELALGPVFSFLLNLPRGLSYIEPLWEKLCKASPNSIELPYFWTNMLRLAKSSKSIELSTPHADVLRQSLITCLSSPSHRIRQDALYLLQVLYKKADAELPNCLSIMILIESTQISLETSRSISMNIRRLAPAYQILAAHDLMTKAVPQFCFGLLHLNLAQAWEDAIVTLVSICDKKHGEEVVISLVQSWLEGAQVDDQFEGSNTLLDINSDGFKVFSDFECPNLAKISAISAQVFKETDLGTLAPSSSSSSNEKVAPYLTPNSRTQALKLLQKIPSLAEKRSRLLVPVLLGWAGNVSDDDEDKLSSTDRAHVRWSRKDQKAMLSVFAQFVNPRVLYRSDDVHAALLALCANGDVEIQRSAFKALLAWKDKVLVKHQEHLSNLLDDARFREEISVFLQSNGEDRTEDESIKKEEYEKLMPVLLRLLYGKAVAGGKEGQAGRRKAIFVALSNFGQNVLDQYLSIAMASLDAADLSADQSADSLIAKPVTAPLRQQVGLLNMLADMLQTLGSELEFSATRIMNATLLCTVSAARSLSQESMTGETTQTSLLRSVRQTGLQCLVKIFTTFESYSFHDQGRIIVDELVAPRMDSFVVENAQSISGILRLFGAWARRADTAVFFADSGSLMLVRAADLLQGQHTKDDVRTFILQELLPSLLSPGTDSSITQPIVSNFVKSIGSVIQRQPSKDVLDASVAAFSQLADRIVNSDEAADVVRTCTDLLRKPSKEVSQYTKAGLLKTLLPLIESFDLVDNYEMLLKAICPLFSRLTDPENRTLLAQVLQMLVRHDQALSQTAHACGDMAAMGVRLDEPDYDRREKAFQSIYDSYTTLGLNQWTPIVHSCLFYIRDPEDRVIRSSASHALMLFIEAAALHQDSEEPGWNALLDDAIFSNIEYGMRAPSELVRAEYLIVLGCIVEKVPTLPKVAGMQALIVGGDEEASFFSNALHIQHHRRLRALRRLSEDCSGLSAQSVNRIFLPLLEHFVFDQVEGDTGRTLSDQAVQTIGTLAQAVNWQSFRSTLQRYTGYLKSKPDLEKIVLRLLGAMVDGLKPAVVESHSEQIIRDHLPPLLEYLHQKDESTVDRRMPVAVTIVKLLKMLPATEFAARLPAVLTDVSHVLRSRSQEARDQTRKSLTTIASLIGVEYFKFILKELRSALKRGYQLHVLSFTVHSLLVSNAFVPGDLDECLQDLMLVVMDDIFGVTGQEKDAEEYKSGAKEVKSSKSFDTMELLARTTPIRKLGELVSPIRAMLSERIDLKSVKKIDELLTRLRKGLDQNPASESRDMLSFCWEIVNQVYAEDAAANAPAEKVDERRKRYIVQPEARLTKSKNGATSFRFKLISFALNLLRKVLRRHEDLQTPQNMAGFLPIAGDALVQGQEEVKLAAVRLLSTIMRVSMPQLEDNAPVYVKEAVGMVKGSANTTTDASKAALELITSVLREKRSVEVKEKDIAVILKSIKTDIDEPDRQGVIYRFLRAIIGRKIVITEVYEVMDEVGKAMVTNPDQSIRESARGAYLQFIMEFPQGKDRWTKQTVFMVGNLQYEHASGRQSVMELLHQVLGKVDEDVLNDMVVRIFVSLLPILVSDVDRSCCDMAGLLVGKIFERVSEQKLNEILGMIETWLRPEKKAGTKSGALQCWAILLQADRVSEKQVEKLRTKVLELLTEEDDVALSEPQVTIDALKSFTILVETHPGVGLSRNSGKLWTTIQSIPESSEDNIRELVATLIGTLFTDFASTSSKLLKGLGSLPLRGSGGLQLDEEELRRLCAVNLRAMKAIGNESTEALVAQTIRNLVFLGRCFAANGIKWQGLQNTNGIEHACDDDDDDDDENEEDDERDPSAKKEPPLALTYILLRLSKLTLQPTQSPPSRLAAMTCISTLLPHLPSTMNLPIQPILRPLYALTDPNIPNPPTAAYKALEDRARELMEQIQRLLGNQAYIAALSVTRAEAKARRDGRRTKRRIEAVSKPEQWAKDKKRKHDTKKIKAKIKGEEARGRRRGW
jgi:U3 small nucleolar RNA-associated protein 20